MSFDEVRLPLALGFGATGGPRRKVEIVALANGAEARNAVWAHARRRYDVGGAIRTLDDLALLLAFFEARRGPLRGFRFRDPVDWRSCAPSRTPAPTDQAIGAGDGANRSFQLVKRYGEGPEAYVRPIRKPEAGSVRVAVAGVELGPTAFACDVATGVVTLTMAPAANATVTAGFAFDVPVRFDADSLETSLDAFGAGRAVSIPLIEVFP